MADKSTFIKLDRNLKRWRWFKNKNTLIVFLVLLLDANVEDHELEHETIHRGQVVTSLASLCISTGLTIQEVRTAILHLKSTGEITSRASRRYQVITITNYDKYQSVQQTKQQRIQHPINNLSTTYQQRYKNIKNVKNEKNNNNIPSGYPYPCGLWEKPEWMTEQEWEKSKYLTADNIPGLYRGEYDSIIEYLHDKKEGCLR